MGLDLWYYGDMWKWILSLFGTNTETEKPSGRTSQYNLSPERFAGESVQNMNASHVFIQSSPKQHPEWYQRFSSTEEWPGITPMEVDGLDWAFVSTTADQIAQEIVPPPSASFKVFQRLGEESVSPQELADLASGDPMIASRILQCVNSAYFGLPTEVTELNRAIVLLGTQQLRVLLSSQALKLQVSPEKARFQDQIGRHSAICALLAGLIAKNAGLDPGRMRTLGLLQSMGKLLAEIKDESPSLEWASLPEPLQNAGLSGAFARAWELPLSISESLERSGIAWVSHVENIPLGMRREASCLAVARFLTNALGFSDGEEAHLPSYGCAEQLGLPKDPHLWIADDWITEVQKTALLI